MRFSYRARYTILGSDILNFKRFLRNSNICNDCFNNNAIFQWQKVLY